MRDLLLTRRYIRAQGMPRGRRDSSLMRLTWFHSMPWIGRTTVAKC